METPDTPELHPALAELEAQIPSRSQLLRDAVRCIGCISARSDEDGALISTPAIAACTGMPRTGPEVNTLYLEMRRLEKAGFVQAYTSEERPSSPGRGGWQFLRTFFFRVTDQGQEVFPVQAQENCGLRNPFARVTPGEQRIIDCARCLLTKTADIEGDLAGGFLTQQIADCQGIKPQSAGRVLRSFHADGLLARKAIPAQTPTGRDKSFLYSPTAKAEPWFTPQRAESCTIFEAEGPPAREFTDSQNRILKCLSCVFNFCDTSVVRRADVFGCTKINTHAVGAFLKKLVREEYLERRDKPGEFIITERGGQLLTGTSPSEDCPSGRLEQWLELQDLAMKRSRGFRAILRCIGCMVVRQEPISTSRIAACNSNEPSGMALKNTGQAVAWIEAAGLIERYVPNELPKMPPWGNWNVGQTGFFRLTDKGWLSIRLMPQEACSLLNPLIRLTPDQEKIISCFRCVLARTADAEIPTAGGVIAQQIADCRNMRQPKPAQLLKSLYDEGLLDRRTISRIVGGTGLGPSLYWPTGKGEPWLLPEEAGDCSGIELSPSVAEEFIITRRLILGCFACITMTLAQNQSLRPITMAEVARCTHLPTSTVEVAFRKLETKGYLERYVNPGRTKTDHYELTGLGERRFGAIRPLRHCYSGRRDTPKVLYPAPEAGETRDPTYGLKLLPTTKFPSGKALLDYLQGTRYEDETCLDLLVRAVENYTRHRIRQEGFLHPYDAAQEVHLALTEKEDAITFPDDLNYIFGIASHKVVDAIRKHTRHRKRNVQIGEKIDKISYEQGPGQSDGFLDVDTIDPSVLLRGIKPTPLNLDLLYEMSLGLHGSGTVDTAAVAANHNMTPGAVRVALHRLRAQLRQNQKLQEIWKTLKDTDEE